MNEEQFQKLSKACHIQFSSEEKAFMLCNLSKVLSYAELLYEINTENIQPCKQVVEDLSNYLREDLIGPTLSKEEFLANAPDKIGGMIKIPPR